MKLRLDGLDQGGVLNRAPEWAVYHPYITGRAIREESDLVWPPPAGCELRTTFPPREN